MQEREQYEAQFEEGLRQGGLSEGQIARLSERHYPVSTAEAVLELRRRGVAANLNRAERWCRDHAIRQVGKSRLWYPSDVDGFGRNLEVQGVTMGPRNAALDAANGRVRTFVLEAIRANSRAERWALAGKIQTVLEACGISMGSRKGCLLGGLNSLVAGVSSNVRIDAGLMLIDTIEALLEAEGEGGGE